jgi:hypothetical protein
MCTPVTLPPHNPLPGPHNTLPDTPTYMLQRTHPSTVTAHTPIHIPDTHTHL